MYKTISNNIIRKFKPCYDPSDVITDETEELSVKQWVEKYRKVITVNDIIWLLLRKEFISKKDLRLFAVWCAREALKLVENPDERIVEACNVAERYANGEATKKELDAARDAADAARVAAYYAANDVANDAASITAYYATLSAYYAAYAVAHPAYMSASSASEDAYASYAVRDIASEAVRDAADAARKIARTAQVDKLLSYFE
jgi:hypothetical protein